jgi:uncharacterized phiE125 gp8 family phage protein
MSDDVSSRLRLVTPPASEPVTLSEAKLFLRIEHSDEDAAITRAIASAREAAEQFLKLALLPQELEFTVACRGLRRIGLPVGPATALDAVTVTGSDGHVAELDETVFRLSVDGCSIFFDRVPSGVSITVGYHASMADTASALPALLKQGILHHVAAILEQREGVAALPVSSLQCYQPFRRISL